MINIKEMQKNRFRFLHKLYELTEGDESKLCRTSEIGKELGFDWSLSERIEQYLKGENLIKYQGNPDIITIMHWGVREIEEALDNPDSPTDHFPAFNFISIGQVINSQIQQGSPEATQVVTINEGKCEELKEIIQSLKKSIDKLNLQPQEKTDVQADIQTIEAQMSSSKPKAKIITECISSIRHILEGVAGSVITSGLLNKIGAF